MNTHNRRAPLTAHLTLVFFFTHIHTRYYTFFQHLHSSSAACLFTVRVGDERSGRQKHFPSPFLCTLSLPWSPPLSIFLFLRLKGFCERPEMKGCPQWERDCRDSAGGPRCYQNCSLRVAPPYKDAHCHCAQFVHVRHQKDAQFSNTDLYSSSMQTVFVHRKSHKYERHIIWRWCNVQWHTLDKHSLSIATYQLQTVKCRYTYCIIPGAFCKNGISFSIFTQSQACTYTDTHKCTHFFVMMNCFSNLLI